jgi:shikimate dehydrogenase
MPQEHAKAPITATTQLCGIILHPAGHTRSPAMHNAAFAAAGIDAAYLAFDVAPADLAGAVAGIRALGLAQVAVSLPHKIEVMQHLDEVDETARAIGAVNTVTRSQGRLRGSNTDCTGAVRAIQRETEIEGRHAVVLGAGGTARAVVHGLISAGARVTVLNRTAARAAALAEALGAENGGGPEQLADVEHEILVNTTSVGLREDRSPIEAAAIRPGSVVLDAVYDPKVTRLLADATAAGAVAIEGKWMLIQQAAVQFETWTGKPAPVAAMERAFDQAGE